MSGKVKSRCARRGRGLVVLVALGLLISPLAGAAAEEAPNPDPWEKMNRGVFWFNEKVDIYFVMHLARGWRFVVPSIGRTAVANFNDTLVMPVVFANDVLQLKPMNAGYDVLRMAYNVSLGIGGLIDIASMIDIPKNDEDFGQTLGYWGVPTGPYLVLPIFGPSSIRGGIGRLGDAAGTYYFSLLPFWVTFIVRGVELVNLRSRYLEEVDEGRREAFDYYVFIRDAYIQNRAAKVARALGEEDAAQDDDDLYYFDDEELDDEELYDLDDDTGSGGAPDQGPPAAGGGDAGEGDSNAP